MIAADQHLKSKSTVKMAQITDILQEREDRQFSEVDLCKSILKANQLLLTASEHALRRKSLGNLGSALQSHRR